MLLFLDDIPASMVIYPLCLDDIPASMVIYPLCMDDIPAGMVNFAVVTRVVIIFSRATFKTIFKHDNLKI